MTKDEIFQTLKGILVEELSIDEANIKLNADLIDDLNVDSIEIVDLVVAMEEQFGFSIPDEEAQDIHTVGDAVNYIYNNLP